jgi:hypothetical protein
VVFLGVCGNPFLYVCVGSRFHEDDVQGSLPLRVSETVLPCAGVSGTHENGTGGVGGNIETRGSRYVSRPEGAVSNVVQSGDLVP